MESVSGIDHLCEQMFERCSGVGAPAGVNRRGLNNCAAWSHEPVKALSLRKLTDRTGAITTATDRWNTGEVFSNQIEIDRWIECEES